MNPETTIRVNVVLDYDVDSSVPKVVSATTDAQHAQVEPDSGKREFTCATEGDDALEVDSLGDVVCIRMRRKSVSRMVVHLGANDADELAAAISAEAALLRRQGSSLA